MAKNYTFAEAVAIINEGKDLEAITDIGRRYPILMHKVTAVTAVAGKAFVDLMSFMPDYLTTNKVNTAMKAAVGESEATEATEADDEIQEPKKMAEATEEDEASAGTDYENMSAKQMWDLLGKAGKRKLAKSTKKADLIEACKQAFGEGATTEDEAEAETEETEAQTEANPYDGKSAMELFKECKKRGIKAAPKKPAKFYADLLVKNDAEATEDNTESNEDEWDEEPKEEAKEPKAKKTAPKAEKKATKKAEPKTESEDDDWDI